VPRRERWGIIGAILEEVEREGARGAQARVSNIALRANLPHDRLLEYLAELGEAGLVTGERMPALTERGKEFLEEYRQWLRVLERFGIRPGADSEGKPQAAPDREAER